MNIEFTPENCESLKKEILAIAKHPTVRREEKAIIGNTIVLLEVLLTLQRIEGLLALGVNAPDGR